MKLSDAIEHMFYEGKPIGVRCKLCGELLTYSAMNVADDPYGVKEHYKELHPEMDIELMMLNASFNRMAEDGLKRELREMRKRTSYKGLIIVSSSFGENSWYKDIPKLFTDEWCISDHSKDIVRDTGTEWNGLFVDHNFVEKLNEIKKDYDMNNKKKVSDNPYDGGTLYSVLRDRILEKRKLLTNATIPNDEMVRELLHTKIEELVPLLVEHELMKANAKFPPFASDMEGWAVLKEEIEEADEELVNIRRWHDQIWIAIRGNRKLHNDYIRLIRTLAQKMMVEAAQVAAMALKYEAMLERNEKKEE